MNSYGMTDNHLTYLFVAPLTYMIVFFVLFVAKYSLSEIARYVLNMSFPFIYLYMMLSGIYTIAKTTSSWLFVFLIFFALALIASFVFEIVNKTLARKRLASQ